MIIQTSYNVQIYSVFLMKPKFFPLLDQALDEGIRRGYRRAYKHVDEPSEESIVESIQEEVLNSLHYYFNFEES